MKRNYIKFKNISKSDETFSIFDTDTKTLIIIDKCYLPDWSKSIRFFIPIRQQLFGVIDRTDKRTRKEIVSTLQQISTGQFGFRFFNTIFETAITFINLWHSTCKAMKDPHLSPLLLDVLSLLLQSTTTTYNNWTPTYLCSQLIRVYSVFSRTKIIFGQSSEALILAAMSMAMPADLVEIIKRISLFTSKKILDTPNTIFEILSLVTEYLFYFIEKIPYFPQCVKDFLYNMSFFNTKKVLIDKMILYLKNYEINKAVVHRDLWRKEVQELLVSIQNNDAVMNFMRVSPTSNRIYSSFVRLCKSLKAYENCARKEPACFVFEGPPGCLKSMIMSKLVAYLKKSTYTHVVKATEDGKDFYDGYNNEEVFVMDDVGQQGISQWRTIINMVSSIKLPLDCASVDLKDTKFFDSDFIFCTTNNFLNITGVTKSDCISDIRALKRRCFVFDFSEVIRQGGSLSGRIFFKRFDVCENRVVNSFPFTTSIPTFIEITSINQIIAWMATITLKCREFFDANLNTAILTTEDDVNISELCKTFGQSTFTDLAAVMFSTSVTIIKEYTNSLIEVFSSTFKNKPSESLTCSVVAIGIMVAAIYFDVFNFRFSKEEDIDVNLQFAVLNAQHWNKALKGQSTNSTLYPAIMERMAVVEILNDTDETVAVSQCLLSGHFVMLVGHCGFKNIGIINLYKDFETYRNRSPMCNNIPIKIVIDDRSLDIMVLKLPAEMVSPFKSCKQFFKPSTKNLARDPHAITAGGILKLNRNYNMEKQEITYYTNRATHTIHPERHFTYEKFTAPGLCGSIIADNDQGIIGMHVCGNDTHGTAIILTDAIKIKIAKLLAEDSLCADVKILASDREGFSGLQAETNHYHHVPDKTSLQPSPLFGFTSSTKFPANLSAFGPKTVEKMAQKSFKTIPVIPVRELQYARSCLETIIPEFTDITDREVIKGNEDLSSLNKDSVNGFGLEKDKEYYIDFENGCYKPELQLIMEEFKNNVEIGNIRIEDVLYYETLKDELRVETKVDKPRSFRVCRLPIILWTKKILGHLFAQVNKNRDFNQIFIGVNPYKDWSKIFERMETMYWLFDGDIGTFDGKQAAQVQDMVNDIVKLRYRGNYPKLLAFLLEIIVRSWILVRNKLYLSTHSMPSGSWLTALFNSFYNRSYSACSIARQAYIANREPMVSWFHEILDGVAGDDKLCGSPANLKDLFNALTLKEFFESIGMEFTTGTKQEIKEPYTPRDEISFLKRTFVYHPKIKKVMCPLSKETILNSIMWYDTKKELSVVLQGKINSFQREMFLHADGKEWVDKLAAYCSQLDIPFARLSEEYMVHLFIDQPDEAFEMYKRDNSKNYSF